VLDRFETDHGHTVATVVLRLTGLRTNIGLVKGTEMWMYCGLIIVVATVGKARRLHLASWFSGMPLREAAGLGSVLMNARGLMELVILSIGLDIKVISPSPVLDDGAHGSGHNLHDHARAEPDLSEGDVGPRGREGWQRKRYSLCGRCAGHGKLRRVNDFG
jgi:hypothetical protein